MTTRHFHLLWLAALTAAACSAGAGKDGYTKQDAGAFARDLPPATDGGGSAKDAGRADAAPPNVFTDAPVFNWDAGSGSGAGGAGMGAPMLSRTSMAPRPRTSWSYRTPRPISGRT
jgi:hypothetical protein